MVASAQEITSTAAIRAAAAVREAAEILSDEDFRAEVRLTRPMLAKLREIAEGRCIGERNVAAVVNAARTTLEWGHARPTQQTELSGSVTIVVETSFPLRGSGTVAISPPQQVVESTPEKRLVLPPRADNGTFRQLAPDALDVAVSLQPPDAPTHPHTPRTEHTERARIAALEAFADL